jgi:hypothetical protein
LWWGEASRAAPSAPPSASRMFIILAMAEGEPSRGSTSRMGRRAASSFSIQGRGRSLTLRRERTSTTWDRSAASVVSCSVPGLLAQLALAQPPTPPPAAWSGRCYPSTARAAIAPCAPGDRTRRRTPRGRRSCSWIVLSSLRHDASVRRSAPARLGGCEWGSAGAGRGNCNSLVRCWWAGGCVVGAEVVAARGGCLRQRDRRRHLRSDLRLFGFDGLSSPLVWGVGEGPFTAAFALRSSLLLFSHPRRRSLSLPVEQSPASHLEFVILQAFRCGGCSYLREWNRSPVCKGTLSMGVRSLWLSRPEHLGI